MPHYIWEKACSTIAYIQKRVPHKAIGKMTPEEAFIGKNLDVGHFKIFGSLAYCHILGDTRTKLDQTAEGGTFLGTVKPQRHIGFLSLEPKELLSDMILSSWRIRHLKGPKIFQLMITMSSQQKL